jgi:hypothetical protein
MNTRQPKVFARIAELPLEELARLEKVEVANRARGREMGVPVSPVSIMGLWLIQRQICGCLAKCGRPLNPRAKHGDPDHIVFSHLHPMSAKGGTHDAINCRLCWAECNSTSGHQEWRDVSKGRRMSVNLGLKPADLEEANEVVRSVGRFRSRGFDKRLTKGFDGRVRERT